MKNREIVEISKKFNSIKNGAFGNRTKVLFLFIKNKRAIEEAKNDYDKTYSSILNEFYESEKTEPVNDKNGNVIDIRIKPDFAMEWFDRVNELDEIDVEIPITKISIDDIDGCDFGIDGMETLAFMIKEFDEDEKE